MPCKITQKINPKKKGLLLFVSFLFISLVFTFFINPEKIPLFPVCYFHSITGLKCPTCGMTRAIHYLLHGNVKTALYYNALIVLLPFTLFLPFVRTDILFNKFTIIAFVSLLVIYAIFRNLFFEPFHVIYNP
jgi:hypothetical protein